MMEEWVLSADGETFSSEVFASRGEAIAAGMEMAAEVVGPDLEAIEDRIDDSNIFYGEIKDSYDGKGPFSVPPDYWVGMMERFRPQVDEEAVIDRLIADADVAAGDYAEGWLENIGAGEEELLQRMLQDAFDRWMAETHNEPSFYLVDCVEHIYGDGKPMDDWEDAR